jgi:AraC-like DNA-binding protein
MISYVVILILPIIIGSFAYFQSVQIINEETESIHSANLDQLRILIDGKLTELNRISSEISINDQIKSFMSLQPPLLPSDEYVKKDIQNTLTRYVIANSFVDNIYIYFKKSNLFLSSSTLYRDDAFNNLVNDLGMSYDDLSQFINNTKYVNYRIIQDRTTENGTSGKIIIAHSIISTSQTVFDATVLITVDENKLMQVIKNVALASKETIILSDAQDNYWLSSGKTDNLGSFLQYIKEKKSGSVFYSEYSGEENTIMRIPSSINGLQYISIMPSKTYLQKVRYIKNIIFIYISFCLVAGLAVSFWITRRNYIPLRNLTQMFANDFGKISGKGQNEYSFLEKGVKELLNEKATIRKRLDQQAQALRNSFIIRLLKGRPDIGSVSEKSLEQNIIEFSGNQFLVLLFQIEDIDRKFLGSVTVDREESVELAYFIVKNIVEELVNEKYSGYAAEIDGMPVCLANFSDSMDIVEEDIFRDVEQIASKAQEFINNNFGIVISPAISNIHPTIFGIAKAYLECVEIMDYKTLTGKNNEIIQYRSIAVNDKQDYESIHSLWKDKLLINSIIDGDYKSAGQILNEIFASEFHEKKQSLQMMKFRMFGLANVILTALGQAKTTEGTDLINELDPINRIVNAKSVTELQRQAGYIFEKINEYYSAANREYVSERVDEIEEYIRNHFHEQDISVVSICEKFQITSSYFSRIFKKHTGTNLPNYIHKLRIERAKQLIGNTDLNINQIAEKVGFYNSLTFGRVFKKYEGITPGQYRERVVTK